jgi:hypothetical protein
MQLCIRTNRKLTDDEIVRIKNISSIQEFLLLNEDFKSNMPPSFPLSKSLKPNYLLGTVSENDDTYDEDFEAMDYIGRKIQHVVPAIVHFFPDDYF